MEPKFKATATLKEAQRLMEHILGDLPPGTDIGILIHACIIMLASAITDVPPEHRQDLMISIIGELEATVDMLTDKNHPAAANPAAREIPIRLPDPDDPAN